jgi:hypothetical protein
VRGQGKKCGAIFFPLNFLWLLSLFQDKESDTESSMSAMAARPDLDFFIPFFIKKESK